MGIEQSYRQAKQLCTYHAMSLVIPTTVMVVDHSHPLAWYRTIIFLISIPGRRQKPFGNLL
jgi:hypothetical protein